MSYLTPGMTIKVERPKGGMRYTPNMVRELGMLAGGTGITPMLQIVRAILKDDEDKTAVTLIYANVTVHDILLRQDLEELAGRFPLRFKLHLVIEKDPDGPRDHGAPRPLDKVNWKGGLGFITEAMIRQYCPAPAPDIKILICGPPPMITAMKRHTEVVIPDPSLTTSRQDTTSRAR
jgi:cytochrome-b5 reductase